MHLLRTKSREEKLVDYLVGAGLLSNDVPVADAAFYRLAGSCSSDTWPTKPWTKTSPVTGCGSSNLCDSHTESGDHLVKKDAANNNTLDKIFKPKLFLPVALFQQTFRRWKSGMDMELRFRRLRRLRASVVLQPLDEFPAFLADFKVWLQHYGHLGFFEFLQQFMKVFLPGTNFRLNSVINTSAWAVTSRMHKLTGKQQVLINFLFLYSILADFVFHQLC